MKTDHKFIDSLQIGRAFAALAVALQHTIFDADRYYTRYTGEGLGPYAQLESWAGLLAAGVDVFFVISGIVMVASTQSGVTSIPRFLYRRAARIFPLWWLLTLAYIAVLVVAPQLFQISYLDPVHATCSLLLIPCTGPGGEAIPLIYAGWTLTYELVFYGLFAISLLAPSRLGSVVLCVFLVFAWHGLSYTPLVSIPAVLHSTQSLMFEFLFGVLIGYWWTRREFEKKYGIPLVVAGIGLLLFSHSPVLSSLPRFIAWGVPALLIVTGLLCLNKSRADQGWLFKFLVFLGAASYSLYLFHFFSLRVFFVGLGKTGLLQQIPAWGSVLLGIVFTVVSSIIVYLICEKPLQRLARNIGTRW